MFSSDNGLFVVYGNNKLIFRFGEKNEDCIVMKVFQQ